MNIFKVAFLTLLLASFGLSSQADTTSTIGSSSAGLTQVLPPLALLIDSAVANAPQMNIAEATSIRSEYTLRLARKDWAELVSITGRYTYGQTILNESISVGLNEARGGYQIFAGVSLPLSFFVGRGDRIKSLEAALDIQEYQKMETRKEVVEMVIQTYNQLLLLQKLIKISAEARESALLQYELAEERFRDGQLSLEELGNTTDMKANFASEYEKQKSEFQYYYSFLERLVGTPFSEFPK